MIEFCTKKRMILGISTLIGLSVVIFIVENHMSMDSEIKDMTQSLENSSKECWEENYFEVIEECAPCSEFEVKYMEHCTATGYVEKVACKLEDKSTKTTYKSCPKVTWIEERNFYIFEGLTAVFGLCSYAMVFMRQKRLDRLLMEKVHKQIAAGV